jgi:hypothetical protein
VKVKKQTFSELWTLETLAGETSQTEEERERFEQFQWLVGVRGGKDER